MFNQVITGLFMRVCHVHREYLPYYDWASELLHEKELLKQDVAEIMQDGRAYYVHFREVEKSIEYGFHRLLVDLMLMSPTEADVGDVIYGPGFDAVFHPNKEATSWRFIPPLKVSGLNDVPSDMPGRIPKQIFERLESGHWRRIS